MVWRVGGGDCAFGSLLVLTHRSITAANTHPAFTHAQAAAGGELSFSESKLKDRGWLSRWPADTQNWPGGAGELCSAWKMTARLTTFATADRRLRGRTNTRYTQAEASFFHGQNIWFRGVLWVLMGNRTGPVLEACDL